MNHIKSFLDRLFYKNYIQNFFVNLIYPIKESSVNINMFLQSIASRFDVVYKYYINEIREYFVFTSADIVSFAKERGIVRIHGESIEAFKNRVRNSYKFFRYSATLDGMTAIIHDSLGRSTADGYPLFIIRELYKENWILGQEPLGFIFETDESGNIVHHKKKYTTVLQSVDMANYFVVDFMNNPLELNEKMYLEELIKQYKPAHIGFHINAKVLDDWILDATERLGISTYLGVK